MNPLSQLIMLARQNLRLVLIATVGILLLLNGVQWLRVTYLSKLEEIDTRKALLEQYQSMVVDRETLGHQVAELEKKQAEIDKLLFVGDSEDRITSAMQIMLQSKVVASGMAAESISPLRQTGGGKEDKKDFQEVAIKARVTGTLSQFMNFISDLYQADEFFMIESVTVRPFKKSELKIFLELRGYYKLLKEEKKPAVKEKKSQDLDNSAEIKE